MAIAAAAAPSLIGSDPIVVSVTIRPGFELGGVLTIRIDGHVGGPIVEVARLRTDTKPGDVNEALGESERPSVNRRGAAGRDGSSYDLTTTVLAYDK